MSSSSSIHDRESRLAGCILGTAIGDAMGLPFEGLSRDQVSRFLGPRLRYRFIFGRGMVSDDTEHTCMVARALIASGGDTRIFAAQLALYLRWWLASLPAGAGFGTIRACLRLWLGWSPHQSGVHSAGNGPAMRAAILGAAVEDIAVLRALVRASTRLTHSDPKAEYGALVVALAARVASHGDRVEPSYFTECVRAEIGAEAPVLMSLLESASHSIQQGEPPIDFAESQGLSRGVTGYMYHTVPVAIHAWLAHQRDLYRALDAVIRCGGDTDSTAAIVGGIIGASTGVEGIPPELIDGLFEWPRTTQWMRALGSDLAKGIPTKLSLEPPFLATLSRNLFFLTIVLFHGCRRLAPPF